MQTSLHLHASFSGRSLPETHTLPSSIYLGQLHRVSALPSFGRAQLSATQRRLSLHRQQRIQRRCQGRPELDTSQQHALDGLSTEVTETAQQFKELNDEFEVLAADVREKLQGTSIYLVGMMGSGKSTVGRLLASTLQYPFLDSDKIAEQHADARIADIFEQDGEEAFRDLESAVLKELMPFKSCVVATGGGAVVRRKNWGYMQHGVVVWLHGSPDLLARRACQDDISTRPLLGNSSSDEEASEADQIEATREKLAAILDKRKEQYEFADLTVSLRDDDGSPLGAPVSRVTQRLLEALRDRLLQSAKQEPGA